MCTAIHHRRRPGRSRHASSSLHRLRRSCPSSSCESPISATLLTPALTIAPFPEPSGRRPMSTLLPVRTSKNSANQSRKPDLLPPPYRIGYPGIPPNGSDRPQAAVKGVSLLADIRASAHTSTPSPHLPFAMNILFSGH